MRRLHLRAESLEHLWSASPDPPITKASLSELELARIINDARLRHDLNFEREVSFRPNMCGDRGKRKKLDADAYWEALVIEFAIYITRRQSELSDALNSGSLITSPWLQRPSSLQGVPLRLPRMFRAIQDILKTLVPASEWSIVDERLDIDLLLQQLEKVVCDIPTLIEWLGALLLCCCSPQRDPLVTDMVSKIRNGFEKDDPRLLVKGLRDLFGVLELMKLVSSSFQGAKTKLRSSQDVANHQIRYLRLLMVDDTIHFEQKIFLREISNGLDLTNVRAWFQQSDREIGVQMPHTPESQLSAFVRGTVDMIVDGYGSVPPTFRFDVDRIASLQVDFDLSRKQAACGQTFVNTLNALGSELPSLHAYNKFLYRISAIAEYPRLNCNQPDAFKDIALEIVRSAYELIGNERLPEQELIDATTNALLDRWNNETTVSQEHRACFHHALTRLVEQEMAAVKDKTPPQILNYFNPTPINLPAINPYGAIPDVHNGHGSIQNIAKRIAHIATLHWRVWAPILYEQPRRTNATTHHQEMPPREVDLVPTAGMLMSEQESKNDILRKTSVKSDDSSSDEWQSSPV